MVKKVVKSKYIVYRYSTKLPCLVSDGSGRGAFCKFCKQLYCGSHDLPKRSDGTFISKPFTKWSKATGSSAKNNKLLKYQLSNSHRQAVSQAEMCNEVEEEDQCLLNFSVPVMQKNLKTYYAQEVFKSSTLVNDKLSCSHNKVRMFH